MRHLLLVLLCLLQTACTFTYLPPIPERREVAQTLSLRHSEGLRVERGLRLSLTLSQIPQEDWLLVQWYAPDNEQVASDAWWLESEMTTLEFVLPEDIELYSGRWRAVVFYRGDIVRMFSVDVDDA